MAAIQLQRSRTPALIRLWRTEFGGYSAQKLQRDLLAGLTVAAVALPLALAFGVASGANAAAGLVTAVISGFLIGALSGAPYQISGPTGAMSAVLVGIVQKHGLQGLWMAGAMAGAIMLLIGLFKLGGIINFIPAPVITGFTSGIAIVIFSGQIDNLLGVKTAAADTTALKLFGYISKPLPAPSFYALLCGGLVVATMLLLPRWKVTHAWPAALLGIVLATALAWSQGWPVTVIGNVPSTILLAEHLQLSTFSGAMFNDLLAPATAIAALGAIESLLAGTVAGRMTGIRLNANQELIAQGIGNMVLPFAGGVPATAAIARMSVGLKAGGITRMVSFIHAAALLGSALFLGAAIGHIPLAALAGVLMLTAWRMNEWHQIQFYVKRRLKSPTTVMIITMLATVALDLTQAIIIGVMVSLLLFVSQVARLRFTAHDVDWDRMEAAGYHVTQRLEGIKVAYISGPLFFGAVSQLRNHIEGLEDCRVLVLSLRGVHHIDASALQALEEIWQAQIKAGGLLYFAGLHPHEQRMLERSGLYQAIGGDKFYWSADQAIREACTNLTESSGPACEWRGHRHFGTTPAGPVAMPLG
jgi:SulP family sulfate permease